MRGCIDANSIPNPPWWVRKEAYLAHLEHAGPDILLVSCADKLHNAQAIYTGIHVHVLGVFDRFNAGVDRTGWYYSALSEVFSRLLPASLSADLARSVAEMRRLAGNVSAPA